MSPRMLTAVLLTSSFLAVVSTRNLNGVLRYHTDAAGRPNYTPTFGHLCNDSQCMRDAKRQWRPLTHSPVLLSLDELERRQRVAALHRQYISSQQYRPHPQPAAFDLHSLGSHVILAQPHHHRNHHHAQNPQERQESSAAASPDQQSDPHSPHKYRHSHHHPHNQPSHQVAPLLHPVSPFNDTVRVIHNDTCIRCPRRQLARALRNQHLARVPRPKLRFCSRPEDSVIDFPLMVLRGPRMGTFVEEGEYTIVFKTLLPLPAKTCRYTLQVYSLRCPPLPAAEHGSLQCTNGNLWGSRCHLRCDTGFELRGQTTADGYVLNRPNVTATFKCVKRKRQAIWKLPNFQPVCTDKRFVFPTTTKPPKRISFSTKNPGVTSPAPKRRVACRWPKEPPDGWATCGLRGRWKKRLFVREHLPCFRGCNDGFEPSVKLNVDGKKNKISCVGGAWMGFQDFACVNKRDERWKACLRQADKQDHVVCKRTDTSMKCRLECPEGFVVAKRDRPRAEFDCQADDASQHAWPVCQKALPPKLVDGCQNQMVENATFPLPIEEPIYRPAGDDTGPVAVYCNVTAIEQHGEFGIYCTAEDLQLESQANCTFTLFSTASSCRPFKPGKHVVANCGMPSGLLAGIIGYESLPVGALCEFACEKGYTLPTSRLEETYTTCQNDGTWTVSDFDLCKPLENPVVQRACENQTFVVSQIPAGGIPLALPEYVDSMGDDIEPECTHSLVKEFGETLVSCDFDDYEIRTRVSCTFSVTVQRG